MTMNVTRLNTYWTAYEAATVVDFIDILRDALWETYGEEIIRMHREDCSDRIQDTNQYELELNDDIPF